MGEVRFVEVADERAGQRLDNFLARELKGVPRSRLYRAVRKGEIRVNMGRARADYRLREGDRVRIPPLRAGAAPAPAGVPRRWRGLASARLLYEDRGLLAIDKPAGLAAHGGSGQAAGLIECLRLLRGADRYLELAHRLDRETSGCLLVARKAAVLKDLHRQLRDGEMEKVYLALVWGNWPQRRRYVEAPLQKSHLLSGERVARVHPEGKAARTGFRVLRRYPDCTLVEARPLTGRTHQIRVHARHAGHPLLGDEKYAPREQLRWARRRGLRRLFLHARSLRFRNSLGRLQTVECEPPPELAGFLEVLARQPRVPGGPPAPGESPF